MGSLLLSCWPGFVKEAPLTFQAIAVVIGCPLPSEIEGKSLLLKGFHSFISDHAFQTQSTETPGLELT